jgi:hypothetical protein
MWRSILITNKTNNGICIEIITHTRILLRDRSHPHGIQGCFKSQLIMSAFDNPSDQRLTTSLTKIWKTYDRSYCLQSWCCSWGCSVWYRIQISLSLSLSLKIFGYSGNRQRGDDDNLLEFRNCATRTMGQRNPVQKMGQNLHFYCQKLRMG